MTNIDLNHTQIACSRSHITHVTGHLLAWEHAARRLALTDGTWCPVGTRVTVGRVLHGKVVALDGALKPFSDAGSRDINHLPDCKLIDLDLTAHFMAGCGIGAVQTELPESASGCNASLGEMPGLRFLDPNRTTLTRSHLHRGVPIHFQGADLGHAIRLHLNYADRNRHPFRGKDPRHAELAPHHSDRHVFTLKQHLSVKKQRLPNLRGT